MLADGCKVESRYHRPAYKLGLNHHRFHLIPEATSPAQVPLARPTTKEARSAECISSGESLRLLTMPPPHLFYANDHVSQGAAGVTIVGDRRAARVLWSLGRIRLSPHAVIAGSTVSPPRRRRSSMPWPWDVTMGLVRVLRTWWALLVWYGALQSGGTPVGHAGEEEERERTDKSFRTSSH